MKEIVNLEKTNIITKNKRGYPVTEQEQTVTAPLGSGNPLNDSIPQQNHNCNPKNKKNSVFDNNFSKIVAMGNEKANDDGISGYRQAVSKLEMAAYKWEKAASAADMFMWVKRRIF